jgi:flagellar biosynthesis protein FlhF
MKIKKFQARSFREALSLVKRELGRDAVILSSKELGGRGALVEVTAAVDYDLGAVNLSVSQAGRSASGQAGAAQPRVEARVPSGKASVEEVAREVESLKRVIVEMRRKGYEVALPADRREIFEYLRDRHIREDLALALTETARGTAELPALISAGMKARAEGTLKGAIALVGPTGVGKTTTIAKLAARAVKEGKRVAIVNLDTYRIGAIEQIRIYSRILGVPLDVVSDTEGLKKSLTKYAARDAVFIDTTGRNPRSGAHIAELGVIYDAGFPVETHLLMSLNSDDAFLRDSYRHYGMLPVDCLAFTKADEAVRFGSIYNLSTIYQKPVAYVTTGQRVPEDIEFPSNQRLVDLILKGGGEMHGKLEPFEVGARGAGRPAACGVAR